MELAVRNCFSPSPYAKTGKKQHKTDLLGVILLFTIGNPKEDRTSDESTTIIRTYLSPHSEIITHNHRPCGERRDTIHAFGRGAAISSEDHDGSLDSICEF